MATTVTYLAFVEKSPGRGFRAFFPDFPEVRARGAGIRELAARAGDALRGHVHGLVDARDGVPEPASVDALKGDGRYRHGFLLKCRAQVPEGQLYPQSRSGDSSSPAA